MPKSKRPTLGACGEHYVASFLCGMGLEVELTTPGTKLVDMHVAKKNGMKRLAVQVKAGGTAHNHNVRIRKPEESNRVWHVGRKAFGYSKSSHWYAFVTIGNWPLKDDVRAPEIYFIPSRVVAKVLRNNPKNQPDWFWIYDVKIEQYRGLAGFWKLREALSS